VPRLRDGGVGVKGLCDEHGWYTGHCGPCRRDRDLREAYPVAMPDVPLHAPTRPPLRAIAHACREYEAGNSRPLRSILPRL
jgi:hypothetical protein